MSFDLEDGGQSGEIGNENEKNTIQANLHNTHQDNCYDASANENYESKNTKMLKRVFNLKHKPTNSNSKNQKKSKSFTNPQKHKQTQKINAMPHTHTWYNFKKTNRKVLNDFKINSKSDSTARSADTT